MAFWQSKSTKAKKYESQYMPAVGLLHSSGISQQHQGVDALAHLADSWALLDPFEYGNKRDQCIAILTNYLRANPLIKTDFDYRGFASDDPRVHQKILRTISAHNAHQVELSSRIASWNKDETGQIIDLHGIQLPEDMDLSEINLEGVNLSGAYLKDLDLSYSRLNEVNFSAADLSETIFLDSSLRFANLQRTNLSDAILSNADLSCANLWEANLYQASISDVNLSQTNLCEADLRDAQLDSVNLNGTLMHGALYTSFTSFPEGFDPERAGLIKAEDT